MITIDFYEESLKNNFIKVTEVQDSIFVGGDLKVTAAFKTKGKRTQAKHFTVECVTGNVLDMNNNLVGVLL